jgi:hypothetical protein
VYHQYDWSPYESRGSGTLPLGIYSWFDPFTDPSTMITTPKKVNFILSGVSTGGGINTATPWYVTSSSTYLAKFTPASQDVLNVAKDCTNIPWKGTAASSRVMFTGSGTSTLTVTSPSCCTGTWPTLYSNDLVWVYNGSVAAYNVSAQPITVTGMDTFTYTGSGSTSLPCTDCIYITKSQSSPVPYEQPYVTAWQAFMAAANQHFNPGYEVTNASMASVNVGATGTGQLGYVRSGTWTGGESFAYCIQGLNSAGATVGLTQLGSPYAYTCDKATAGNCSSTSGRSQTNTNNTWLIDYTKKINYIQSLNPTLPRYWPIDTIAGDNSYATSMAADAVAAINGQGYLNGFGSQGLSLLDDLGAGCTGAIADWCDLFSMTYQSFGTPRELQQISISDPQTRRVRLYPHPPAEPRRLSPEIYACGSLLQSQITLPCLRYITKTSAWHSIRSTAMSWPARATFLHQE